MFFIISSISCVTKNDPYSKHNGPTFTVISTYGALLLIKVLLDQLLEVGGIHAFLLKPLLELLDKAGCLLVPRDVLKLWLLVSDEVFCLDGALIKMMGGLVFASM